jgi:hypothetical protein
MHKGRRIATTAGATVLTFVALGGVAQADPLGDATGGLTDTLGGVLDSVTGGAVHLSSSSDSAAQSASTSRAGSGGTDPSIGVGLDGPVHANTRVRVNSSPGNGTQADVSLNAGVRRLSGRGDLISASVNVGLDSCGFAPEACGMVPPGDTPGGPPVSPPNTGTRPPTPPGVTGPAGAGPGGPGAATTSAMKESLPFTGGPIGALALIGLAAVLTGSAAVGGSRLRFGRDPK